MKKNSVVLAITFALLLSGVVLGGCAISDITNALSNLKNLQFKLGDVSGFRIAGVDIGNKRKIADFSISEGLALGRAFSSDRLPAEFVLNVLAKNPNDGKDGKRASSITLVGIDYRLILDGVQTISGDITSPVTIPANNRETVIPVSMKLDLFEFFGKRGYESVINLALALGGVSGSSSKVKLDIRPTIKTPLVGEFKYPGRIVVLDTEYSK